MEVVHLDVIVFTTLIEYINIEPSMYKEQR